MQVVDQVYDANLGRMATRVVLPRVIMHSRQHYGVIWLPAPFLYSSLPHCQHLGLQFVSELYFSHSLMFVIRICS